ncbi:MAG: glutamate racemase [Candidatus Marinimicrobia bacterium]|nr:glutamate racemase [Candidatus Neomarinimicrobiota bacterium]
MNKSHGPIGIFDSGLGGLTVFHEIRNLLPDYDYLYLGDTARTPYGTRSFETIYHYTQQGVSYLLDAGCPLVILACNTASAKALRTIQQKDLVAHYPNERVLGVIRPSVEVVGENSKTKKIGLFGTSGTVRSESYKMEFDKLFPDVTLYQQACPMWVPLVENNETDTPAADYFVKRHVDALLKECDDIDTIILACTHYPMLMEKIRKYVPNHIDIMDQGPLVADKLDDYLHRHPEIEGRCIKNGESKFMTTGSADLFEENAEVFFGEKISAMHVELF